jgi:NitT/TauT family transport system substrate-binding protein
MKRWFVVATSLIVVLAACQRAAPPPSEVTLAMGYIPNVQFAPFYVAVEKGYYAQEGLAINFDYGMETDLLSLVGQGKLKFAVASGDQVILARSQGLPVVYIMTYYQKFPIAVASLNKPLKGPEDLKGLKVGLPGLYGANYIGWRALLYAAGIPEEEIPLDSIGYTQVASLTQGRVEAAVVYANNEPVQLRQEGYEPYLLYVADYIDLVSNGLITNEETISKDPDLVERLVRATLHGLRDAIADPEAAFQICKKYVPEMTEAQLEVLRATIPFWESDPLGYSDPAAWEASQRFMLEVGLIDKETPIEKIFTNRFVKP